MNFRSGWFQTLLFALFVGAVFSLLFALSRTRAPEIPLDGTHRMLQGDAICVDCHAPGEESPLGERHPPKEQCGKCHRMARK